jgi:hypothetical protein
MKKQNMILLFLLSAMIVSTSMVFANGVVVPPGQEKYSSSIYTPAKSCQYTTYWPNGTIKRVYASNSGYLSVNHLTGQEQCYLAMRSRGGKKTAVSSPVTPVCTTKLVCEKVEKCETLKYYDHSSHSWKSKEVCVPVMIPGEEEVCKTIFGKKVCYHPLVQKETCNKVSSCA